MSDYKIKYDDLDMEETVEDIDGVEYLFDFKYFLKDKKKIHMARADIVRSVSLVKENK